MRSVVDETTAANAAVGHPTAPGFARDSDPGNLGQTTLQFRARLEVFIDEVTTGDYFGRMIAVGVKQLKARLSEYLRAVKAGQIVLVTDRDEVVAELRPPREPPPIPESEDTLQALADAGEVTRADLTKGSWQWRARGLGLEEDTVEALLDELRADRDPEGDADGGRGRVADVD